MKCTNCKNNEAVVYIKKNINGKVTEEALCSECAKKNGEMSFDNFSNGLFNGLFGYRPTVEKTKKTKCDLCGTTFEEIKRTGRIGCAHCYDVFKDELSKVIESIYGNAVYHGSLYELPENNSVNDTADKSETEKMKEELRLAVINEDYEKAAVLRDKIKQAEANDNA